MMVSASASSKALLRLWPGAVLACLALASSCKGVETFDPPGRPLFSSTSPLAVTLSPELRGLRKRSTQNGDRTVYKVGHLLRRLFQGEDGHAFLNLVASEIEISGGYLGPWTGRYELVVALQLAGTYHLLQVQGNGASDSAPRQAGKEAVEDCVLQFYERLAALVGPAALREPS
jgi:hypothetical protein